MLATHRSQPVSANATYRPLTAWEDSELSVNATPGEDLWLCRKQFVLNNGRLRLYETLRKLLLLWSLPVDGH
jgi:hypothetical protein